MRSRRAANARLIAAVPELLAALKRLVLLADDDWNGVQNDDLDAARALIARIEKD